MKILILSLNHLIDAMNGANKGNGERQPLTASAPSLEDGERQSLSLSFGEYRKVVDEALKYPNLWLTMPGDAMDVFIYQGIDGKYLVWAMDTDKGFTAKKIKIPKNIADIMDILAEVEEVKDDIIYYLLANFPKYLNLEVVE